MSEQKYGLRVDRRIIPGLQGASAGFLSRLLRYVAGQEPVNPIVGTPGRFGGDRAAASGEAR